MVKKKAPVPLPRSARPSKVIKLKGKVDDLPSIVKKKKGITRGGNGGAKYDMQPTTYDINAYGQPVTKFARPKPGKRKTAKLSK